MPISGTDGHGECHRHLLQGSLLGGLYALFAAGLSLMFGVMRLVNLAHGDIIVLAAFLILVAAQSLGLSTLEGTVLAIPVLFGVGFVLQVGLLNRVLGRDILPPLLTTFGLSIIIQNGLLQGFSADTRRLAAPGIETTSLPLGAGLAVGLVPLLTFAAAILVISRPQRGLLSHVAGPRFPRRFGRSGHSAVDGHRQSPPVRHCHRPRARHRSHRRTLSRVPAPTSTPAPARRG